MTRVVRVLRGIILGIWLMLDIHGGNLGEPLASVLIFVYFATNVIYLREPRGQESLSASPGALRRQRTAVQVAYTLASIGLWGLHMLTRYMVPAGAWPAPVRPLLLIALLSLLHMPLDQKKYDPGAHAQ